MKTLTLEPTRIATSARGPRLFKVPHPSVLCVCVCVCVCVFVFPFFSCAALVSWLFPSSFPCPGATRPTENRWLQKGRRPAFFGVRSTCPLRREELL